MSELLSLVLLFAPQIPLLQGFDYPPNPEPQEQDVARERGYGDFKPTKQGGLNVRRIIDVSIRPNEWAFLLEDETVVAELECSESQLKEIRKIRFLHPVDLARSDPILASVKSRGNAPVVYFLTEKEFQPYLKRYIQVLKKQEDEHVASLTEILRPAQVVRIKQLQFQHNLLVLNNPKLALAVYGIRLSDEESREIKSNSSLATSTARLVHPRLTFEYRYEAISKVINKSTFEDEYDPIFIPSVMKDRQGRFEQLLRMLRASESTARHKPPENRRRTQSNDEIQQDSIVNE